MTKHAGVVGFGFMGKMHTGILASHPDVKVVAVCDANPNSFSKENLMLAGNIATGCAYRTCAGIERSTERPDRSRCVG